MTSILLIAVGMGVVAAMTSVAVMAITATRPELEAVTVSPFGAVGVGCPAADTLSNAAAETVLPDRHAGEWKIATLNSLTEVESFLDYLENNRVSDREMHVLTNNSFAVRWKAAA